MNCSKFIFLGNHLLSDSHTNTVNVDLPRMQRVHGYRVFSSSLFRTYLQNTLEQPYKTYNLLDTISQGIFSHS